MKYDHWIIKSRYPSNLFETLLKNRKVKDPENFLNPDYTNLVATSQLLNLDKAKKRIVKSIKQDKLIGIFCDYDADGVSGGAIIYRVLQSLGAKVLEYVPERKEGYGLNSSAVDYFAKNKIDLLITVDCGIKNISQIAELKKLGIATIIVDHHIIEESVPNAIIVHPQLTKNKSNLQLSGGGTAYMLARELFGENGQEKWLIDLAAISSVADVVPFNHDNRIIVKYGLKVLQKTKNDGLKCLIEKCGLKGKALNVYDLGFAIAPRLNAAGRIAHPRDSFDLLAGKGDYADIAEKLNKLNQKRQEMLAQAVEEAIKVVEADQSFLNNVIICKGNWDEGIVGLIASKICEKYYRPTIVLSEKGKKLKGSARSVEKVNITELLSSCQKLLLSFGGHAAAAGLSLEKKNFGKFQKNILKESEAIDKDSFKRSLKVDAVVDLDEINMKTAKTIEKLAPFGPGNSRPVLALEKVDITGFKIIGKDKNHKKVDFKAGENLGSFLLFNFSAHSESVCINDKVDIAFTLNINEFRGETKLDLIVEDVKKIS